MFSRGTMRGETASRPIGGHSLPSSTVGLRALWKKAQNTLMKNMASVVMKRPTPMTCACWTTLVCRPSRLASRATSFFF